MQDNNIAPRRLTPLHGPATRSFDPQKCLENRDIQQDAASEPGTQPPTVPSTEAYTISVDHVREHLREKGLSKSKDTIQRWCRNGDLDCQKRGVLQRYFTTEASLQRLEQKLLPDMIASEAGVRKTTKPLQSHAPSDATANSSLHRQAIESAGESSGAQANLGADTQPHAAEGPTASLQQPAATAKQSRLEAENEGLRALLESRERHIAFLEEEVRAGREQRGAVVQISNRMLETLETIAVGGRLERPRRSAQGEVVEREPESVNSDRL